MTHRILLWACLLMIGCGPIVMVPGGALSGEVMPLPSSWAFTDQVETVQLETRPSNPYSVNIWAINVDNTMFVVAGGGQETAWARHIADDDRVRLRVEKSVYELRAVEANDESSRDQFLKAAFVKYDFSPDEEDVSKAVLYRLEAR